MQSVKIDRLLRVAVVVLTAALLYSIYAGMHERVIAAGDSAPAFQLRTDDGRTVSIPDFKGKLLVLNFWATWCPPCVEETPSLSQFARDFTAKGVVVLGVSVDKDEKAYRAFLQKYNPAFLTVRDTELHEDFGTFMYPETYIINAAGKVVHKIVAPADWADPKLTGFINSLL
jgi:cytochrome c biogenesis protein CcmG, thiol:disulfide interchange protein DsbE